MRSQLSVLGIDPGLSGAAVLYIPETGEITARRDFKGLESLAAGVRELAEQATYAVVEFVSARPGQGVASMFRFGHSTGVAIGVLECVGLPWIDVTPQTWQAWVRTYLGIGPKDPFMSCEAALQCLPQAYHSLVRRVKDHNTADAYFLALFGAVHANARRTSAGSHSKKERLPTLDDLLVLQMERQAAMAKV